MPDRMHENAMENRMNESRMNETNPHGNMPSLRDNNPTMPDTYRNDYRDIYRGYRHDRMNKEGNMFRNAKNYKKYDSEGEIFERIIGHMTKGIMFHDRMMDMYGFLGLDGFKKMHEYQYYHESMGRRKLKCYMLDHLNLLAEDVGVNEDGLQFIPQNWYGYTRHDITADMKKQYIMPSFQAYREWEDETKEFLSYCANELMYMGRVSDFNTITEMIEDVEEELKTIDSMLLKISSVDFDIKYVLGMQDEFYHDYEKKLEHCFKEKIEEDKKKKGYMHAEEDEGVGNHAFAVRRSRMTGRYMR